MARSHGKIETGFWQNHKTRRLSDDAKLLLIYLCTSPHSTAASAYVLPTNYASHDLGWPVERIAKGFQELSLKPFAVRDEITDVVFLPGWWEHNKPENPNVAGYAAKLLLALPDCPLKARAINGMREEVKFTDAIYKVLGEWSWEPSQEQLPLTLPERSGEGFSEGFSEGFRPSRAEQSLNLTEPNRTEQDARSREKPRVRIKKSRLPDDWKPTDEDRAHARKRGLNDAEIELEAEAFARYWTGPDAVKGGLKSDWHRTWCNRIDEVADRIVQRRPKGSNGNGSVETSSGPPHRNRARYFLKTGSWDEQRWGPRDDVPAHIWDEVKAEAGAA